MTRTNLPPEEGLSLPEGLGNLIKTLSREGTSERVIRRTPFFFPTVGTNFSRITCSFEDGREISYFVKKFDREAYFAPVRGASPGWKRARTKKPPAVIEHAYLDAYRRMGCNVPKSTAVNGFTLIMEDCGVLTLEEKIRSLTSEEQETVFSSLIPHLVKLARAGRRIALPENVMDRIRGYSDMDHLFRYLHKYWRPGATPEEVDDFLKKTEIFRHPKKEQFFLGDSSTFHILYKDGTTPMWVDLEKLKYGHQSRELAGLVFSPEVGLSFDAAERFLRQFKEEEYSAEKGVRNGDFEREWREYLQAFYRDGAVPELFRRGTAIRLLETRYPGKFADFVGRHTGFRDAFRSAQAELLSTTTRVENCGLYSHEEVEKLKVGVNEILDIMS